ncbi:DHA2 family efflux MFS transporter permease subunit [Acidiphilium sp. AL]|uniref:DHA2 family efflux MFS transporter permease subunit n=1 Tax=Acidiphilium iwatense TaxID=768198 RepID=A0ABS9DTB9_9PROT|nr:MULTISPECIES: DHA2 family efflux MFS transporter permease subunit [Acidiphilium]MCF3945979.1 DHA2 family efflux MFS transporter permease subunit [Acidiphilium iwatense]MCU4159141.1 DHA2 family efflux MFS transporter permease subunit [Acidiphilium sp. AL]
MAGQDAPKEEVMRIGGMPRVIVTVGCMIGTLMQALDATIANVSLPYMQGSLSASYDEITWVLTSYVIAAAIMTAPVGWLATRFGRKNIFLISLIGFTITSMMCGVATSLGEMVADRLLQGVFGAALVPLSQSTMLDIYPVEQRGSAMAIWGIGVMIGPILGPTLGGYLTYFYNWRYVFFVNLPFGIAATLALVFFMPKRAKRPASGHFDWIGFGVLSLFLASLQIMLDRGQEKDWFGSTEIITFAVLAVIGLYLFVVHMFTAENPFIPRGVFRDRNLNAGLITMFAVGSVLLSSSTLMPPFLEKLGNYPVEAAGLVMAPRGFGTMAAMMIAGRLSNKIDPRYMMFLGFMLLLVSFWMMMQWLPSSPQSYLLETIIVQGAGLGFVFTPLQVVAFYTLDPGLRTQGTSLLSLTRNVGMAVGISITEAVQVQMAQVSHASISQSISPFDRMLQVGGSVGKMLDPATKQGAALLNAMIDTQSQIISFLDAFKFMLIISIPAVFCLLLMRKPPPAATPAADKHEMAVME